MTTSLQLYYTLGLSISLVVVTAVETTNVHLYASIPTNGSFWQSPLGRGLNVQGSLDQISTLIGPTPLGSSFTRTISTAYGNSLPTGGVGEGYSGNEVVGPTPTTHVTESFQIVNEWKYLDFEYPTYALRQQAISNRDFVPENNLPLGIDVFGDRMFITTPRWKDGVPASLNYLPFPTKERSPALRPYPDWNAHSAVQQPNCAKLISVYRSSIDVCGRLWLIDSGIVNATVNLNQICPPKIVAFELATDEMVVSFTLPPEQVKQDSLHSNILADVRASQCDDAHVYVTDVWRFGIVVYSLAKNRSWRVTNYNLNPNPVASDFNVYGLNFQWLDGVFGMSLSLVQHNKSTLYFHPMASFKEFAISTDLLRDESLWPARAQEVAKHFVEIGDRGPLSQSSAAGIARNGVMFYTQVHQDNIGCWDTAKPYVRGNLAMLLSSRQTLVQFPNDMKIDQEPQQGVWVMSNRLPIYLYGQLDYSDINFRILRAEVEEVIRNSVCDPKVKEVHADIPVVVELHEGQCY
ncbi:PREDICTED: protein yellow [Rhagoletis zephyria]|uniref:protein yellow n=1 Tax=Rhagoletis zephyria TaxID=28612 RepID=UPI0008112F59|nr:PREDICTED: protein yellow [Rhagoletis zephyria]XP_017473955.1 PREDICTED: protein yellow [Rhagoletis zephyria]XP_017473956.1 PREDICTED: protein yellow [Rhagoletis zephyria]XP_036335014.1 protein yellow [Rhagoletis pomonella]